MHLMAEQDAPTRTDLSDLVRARRRELGLSYERLGQRAVDPETGTKVPGSWFHRLATGEKVQVPDLPRLRAIAAATDCALGRVQDAAGAQFFGIATTWSISGEARALVEQAGQMTPEQREQLRRFIETFTRND
jgi:hypothetical protein